MANKSKQAGRQQLARACVGAEAAQLFVGDGFDEQTNAKEQACDGHHGDGLGQGVPRGRVKQGAKWRGHREHDDALKQEHLDKTAPPPAVTPSFSHADVAWVLPTVLGPQMQVDGQPQRPENHGPVDDPAHQVRPVQSDDAGRSDDDETEAPKYVHDGHKAARNGAKPSQDSNRQHRDGFQRDCVHVPARTPPSITMPPTLSPSAAISGFHQNEAKTPPAPMRTLHIESSGRCRIRTHVSGSEGRKDIQTTLIAQWSSHMPTLLE